MKISELKNIYPFHDAKIVNVFKNDDNCTLEKIIFTLDEDTSFAARILVKILLRLRIAPEAALKTAKKFYLMTKEFPQGNYSVNSSSNA